MHVRLIFSGECKQVTSAKKLCVLIINYKRFISVSKMDDKASCNRNPSPCFAQKGEECKIILDDNSSKEGELNQMIQTDQEETEYEELDPRVQEELEKLNLCTDKINEFELQLEEANAVFRTLLTGKSSTVKMVSECLPQCNISQ